MTRSPANGLTVRPARREDVPRVWELLQGLARYERLEAEVTGSAARLEEHLFGEPRRVECVVAEAGGRLAGYALFFPTYSSFQTEPTMWLEDLYVEESARGRGIGRALLAHVAAIALERGHARLAWVVLDWNRPSIEFYERSGATRPPDGWLTYGLDVPAMRALARDVSGAGRSATAERSAAD